MNTRCAMLLLGLVMNGAWALAAECRLTIVGDGDWVRVSYPTETTSQYQVLTSSDLHEWVEVVPWTPGDGFEALQLLAPPPEGPLFVRVAVALLPAGLAPEPAAMAGVLVGTKRWGYKFTSATEFDWSGETGRWSYTKTGPDTGVVVFTYDSNGNRPEVYREEAVLTFTASLQGTTRYSEYWGGVEDPESVAVGLFNLNSGLLDLAPTAEVMMARLALHDWEGYSFLSVTRFEASGYAGDWSYSKIGPNQGRIVLTYDDSGNDPQVYRDEMLLTFFTTLTGTCRHSVFEAGTEDPASVIAAEPFMLP